MYQYDLISIFIITLQSIKFIIVDLFKTYTLLNKSTFYIIYYINII